MNESDSSKDFDGLSESSSWTASSVPDVFRTTGIAAKSSGAKKHCDTAKKQLSFTTSVGGGGALCGSVPSFVHSDNGISIEQTVTEILKLAEIEKKKVSIETDEKKQHLRKKKRSTDDPEVKIYVKPADVDVLLGRGGRSNHHDGNVRFRDQAGILRTEYRSSHKKEAKVRVANTLVEWVHTKQGGALS